MNTHSEHQTPDAALIRDLGGPTKVARMLGYPQLGGVQRVQNWIKRGIPAAVKVAHPDIFLAAVLGASNNGTRVNRD